MRFSTVLIGLAGMVASVVAMDGDKQDLGTVLSQYKTLTNFTSLIKKYPEILLELPSYDGVTIVAPNDNAFQQIPFTSLKDIWDPKNKDVTVPLIQYHILQGTVNTQQLEAGPTYIRPTLMTDPKFTNVTSGQNILIAKQSDQIVFITGVGNRVILVDNDIPFQGGLIHIVDNLLTPPRGLRETTMTFQVDSFLGGLFETHLMPKLADRENITVFAPSDRSLRYVGGSLDKLSAEELAEVMGYHIVPNQIMASSALTNNTELSTLSKDASGQPKIITVHEFSGGLYVNSAQIQQADLLLANGIMHVISGPLNPDDAVELPVPTVQSQLQVFPVSKLEEVPFTSAIPCTSSCPVTTTSETTPTATPTLAPTPKHKASASATTSSTFTSRSSTGMAAARATVHIAGAAMGIVGLGAGMAML
ncbi:hypothetical protein AK830_g8656 [Neonectria ditissima]|uniref:FAS1 domain-containing protein n=1 Tax=Neonectria ditissima TaxID=78410 RepID=A0A0P7BBS4_9HYPO|nr:hypothetical protein AK830_g8656 [Neonectria ditissima]